MSHPTTDKISAIISTEEELETVISQLIAESVAFSDISVQGNTQQLKEKFGVSFVDPEVIQDSHNPPKKEAFLNDDFGWVISFSFTIPFIIGVILGVFVIGDVRSVADNWIFGSLGGLVGAAIGFAAAWMVKKNHESKLAKQERQGGYVLWVTTHTPHQHQQVIAILKKYHPDSLQT